MALYFFDIRDGMDLVRDDEGIEFGNVDAAVQGGGPFGSRDRDRPAGKHVATGSGSGWA